MTRVALWAVMIKWFCGDGIRITLQGGRSRDFLRLAGSEWDSASALMSVSSTLSNDQGALCHTSHGECYDAVIEALEEIQKILRQHQTTM